MVALDRTSFQMMNHLSQSAPTSSFSYKLDKAYLLYPTDLVYEPITIFPQRTDCRARIAIRINTKVVVLDTASR